ncbi:MAG: SO_0444 family Cu/Zn efflux transporter [Candidatus Krumholzibacteriota bacterium]|nr:SO_0444 family Cu/Zn efflux transporter [Candidatus Krumholzibacteriota bacterium]
MKEFFLNFILELFGTLKEMSPYLIFGFFVAGLLSVFIRPETVEKHLGGGGFLQVIKASLFGVPLPLCSCGVIPVAVSLRKHGASRGAMTSFLISTPQTGIDSIFVTLSLLGPVYAVFRPIVAFVSGIVGGAAVNILVKNGDDQTQEVPVCRDACCTADGNRRKFTEVFQYAFRTLPADINKALIFGIVIAGVIGALIPDDFLTGILGGGIVAMLAMMALGIPIYVCATASVPIAAAIIAKGVSPGAALVFLMTGPATNAAAVLALGKILGKRSAVIYLATLAVSAVTAGILLDLVYSSPNVAQPAGMPFMLPEWVKVSSAAVLSAVIAASFFQRRKAVFREGGTGEEKIIIKIEGMTCQHCVNSIKRTILETSGVEGAEVDLKRGDAVIWGKRLDQSRFVESLGSLGYKVTGREEFPRSE